MVVIANQRKQDIRFGKGKPKDGRTRNWTIIVYEDSAPADWREILRALHVPVYISPYHDRDIRANGEPKKPHWHVVLCFKGKKSVEQIQAISDMLSGTKVIWEQCAVGDLDGMVRYLIHFDDADKAQYDINGIECMGGADVLAHFATANDVDEIVGQVMDWCIEQTCYSFFRLGNYARANRPDWFRVITTSRTVFLTNWLKSMQWDLRMEQQGIDTARYTPNDFPDPDPADTDPDYSDFEPEYIESESLFIEGERERDDEIDDEIGGRAIFVEPDGIKVYPDPDGEYDGVAKTVTKGVATGVAMATGVATHRHGKCCLNCGSTNIVKHGKTPAGTQRYSCKDCGARYAG